MKTLTLFTDHSNLLLPGYEQYSTEIAKFPLHGIRESVRLQVYVGKVIKDFKKNTRNFPAVIFGMWAMSMLITNLSPIALGWCWVLHLTCLIVVFFQAVGYIKVLG